ncbi:hypothetical protein B0J14DRAFT_238421 [Halenospora varia]|nr:hypothetical protein B0J14DRAFT_238421 [Halenospora varia]
MSKMPLICLLSSFGVHSWHCIHKCNHRCQGGDWFTKRNKASEVFYDTNEDNDEEDISDAFTEILVFHRLPFPPLNPPSHYTQVLTGHRYPLSMPRLAQTRVSKS